LLDEKHINSLEHMWVYQDWIKYAFDKKVKTCEFEVRDLVLKENQKTSHQECQLRDKFPPNLLGPYIIKRKFGKGIYHLANLEGNEECESINIINLHPFYSYKTSIFCNNNNS